MHGTPKTAEAPSILAAKSEEVRGRLDRVTDPELDESVVAMGFINKIDVDGPVVSVDFQLPTFWCSANFAFLMAEDMRIAVESLDWVNRAAVRLIDHFAAERINRGIADRLPFEQVFDDDAVDGLDVVRTTFRQKAFLGRQSALLDHLVEREGTAAALALSIAGLTGLIHDPDAEVATAAARYLAARRHDGGPAADSDPAFTTIEGGPLDEVGLPAHRRLARGVLRTARANAEICRMYAEARANRINIEALEQRPERQTR